MTTPSDPILQCPIPRPMAMDPRWRANIEPAPNCPRCASSNTKFCYYNNYSLSQPRYFCKGCRRYWTKGGSLRNVPVGGGCRKTRRSRSKASASSSGGSGPCPGNPSPHSSSGFCQESGGPDIDMAAVFARFLSNDHQSKVNEEINEATNTPSEASHDSFTSSSGGLENGFESHRFPDDVVFDQEFQMTQEFTPSNHKQLEEDEAIQEFITSDFGAFDDIVDDVFWSDDSNLSSFTWQPVPDLQEFDSPSLPVEQSKISTNLLSYDNWSGFDTMVFEAFPRH